MNDARYRWDMQFPHPGMDCVATSAGRARAARACAPGRVPIQVPARAVEASQVIDAAHCGRGLAALHRGRLQGPVAAVSVAASRHGRQRQPAALPTHRLAPGRAPVGFATERRCTHCTVEPRPAPWRAGIVAPRCTTVTPGRARCRRRAGCAAGFAPLAPPDGWAALSASRRRGRRSGPGRSAPKCRRCWRRPESAGCRRCAVRRRLPRHDNARGGCRRY